MSNLLPLILRLGENGGLEEAINYDYGLRKGVYIYRGILTSKMIGEWFDLDYKEIDLIAASI